MVDTRSPALPSVAAEARYQAFSAVVNSHCNAAPPAQRCATTPTTPSPRTTHCGAPHDGASAVRLADTCRHGYDLLYYQLSEAGCLHPRWGRRHPSYCKLPAIALALRRYDTVALLDSDSWFSRSAPSLLDIEAMHRAPTADASQPSVLFGWDHPYSNGPNCG